MNGPSSKLAVVTGAAGGIGVAIVERLRRAGYEVEAVGRSQENLTSAFPEQPEIRTVAVDVSDREATMAALSTGAPVAVVVLAAGLCEVAELGDPSADEVWQRVIGVNLHGVHHSLQALFSRLVDGGRIVIISSGLGKLGRAGYTAYAASKHGVLGMTRCLALELAPRRITVNAVCPGWVDTAMARADAGDTRSQTEAAVPLGRWVRPDEVAALVAWLASAEAAMITGQAYNISGGEFSL